MLNPALYLVVFYFVVRRSSCGNGIPYFAIYLLSGLLVWNLFSTAPAARHAARSSGNAGLVKKVSFPGEILPLASVGAALVHFFLQSLVLFVALAGRSAATSTGRTSRCCSLALIVLLLLTARARHPALGAINVYLRDTQHLLELAPARVVLGHADRLPVLQPGRQGRHEPVDDGCASLQPGHADRAHVPARDLRPADDPDPKGVNAPITAPDYADHWWYLAATSGIVVRARFVAARGRARGLRPARRQLRRGALRRAGARSRSAASPSASGSTTRSTPRSRSGSIHFGRIPYEEFWALQRHRPRRSTRARPSGCSATTARASRRCSSASPASCTPTTGEIVTRGRGWPRCSSSAPASTPTSPAARTSTSTARSSGCSQARDRAALRRHRRLRRARAVHRQAGEALLVGHVRAARLRGRGQRRPRHPARRRGAGGRRRGVPAQVPRPGQAVPDARAARSSSSPTPPTSCARSATGPPCSTTARW